MEGSGNWWRSEKVDGLREAYANTGSIVTMWEVLHHPFNCFCFTPHFYTFYVLYMGPLKYNSGQNNKHSYLLHLLVRTFLTDNIKGASV